MVLPSWVQRSDHFPRSAACTVSGADQNGAGLGPLGTLLACVFVFLQVFSCVNVYSTGNIRLFRSLKEKFWSMMALKSQITFFFFFFFLSYRVLFNTLMKSEVSGFHLSHPLGMTQVCKFWLKLLNSQIDLILSLLLCHLLCSVVSCE